MPLRRTPISPLPCCCCRRSTRNMRITGSSPDRGAFAVSSRRRDTPRAMPTRVFLTIDTELMWRHHVAGLDMETIVQRSLEPAGVGIGWQLEQLGRHGLKATFFVDPMPALVYGLDPIKRVVGAILAAGQEVQLHLHPNWTGATAGDRGASYGPFELIDYSLDEQIKLLSGATDMLVACGAPEPVAFRSGSYSASDDTLLALAELGFRYDSSHNGS